ncbi:MAG: lipopolysaccharide kinase InaA family protein [Opitutales bacterium]
MSPPVPKNTPVELTLVEAAGDAPAGGSIQLLPERCLRLLPGRREVYAARLPEEDCAVVAKRFLVHRRQMRDWQREWRGLKRLAELGLPAPAPRFVGSDPASGAVWVVMRYIGQAEPLDVVFEQADEETTEQLADTLARLVDAMHGAGAWQQDQHIGNLLWDGHQIHLLDAGTMRFRKGGRSLGPRRRLADLAGICSTLPPCAEKAFRSALKTRYHPDKSAGGKRLFDQLEAAVSKVQIKRGKRYFKKTRRDCTQFLRVNRPDCRGFQVRDAQAELCERFFSEPEALMNKGICLKAGNTCTIQRFTHSDKEYVLKRYNKKTGLKNLRRRFVPSRALKSWSNAWVLRLSFVPTPRPLAVRESPTVPGGGLCYFLMEHVDGELLPEFAERTPPENESFAIVAQGFAETWRRLGRLRAIHGDFKATNWVVAPNHELYLLDLDAMRFGVRSFVFRRGRAKDWRRFVRNWPNNPKALEVFKKALRASRSKEGPSVPS